MIMVDLVEFFKKETVFSISLILALISCFFVRPSIGYLNYINWDTIVLLFAIMLVVEVLKNLTIFEILVRKLLIRVKSTRGLVFLLVFACFLSSIFITNDVSLIIFVPFAILALRKIDRTDLIVYTLCLQTIAANIGCMVLPIGAPHNIVLYTVSNVSFESFFLILLPYMIVSVMFLMILVLLTPNDRIRPLSFRKIDVNWDSFIKRVVFGVDYFLLLTFIALFILIGNLENIPVFTLIFKKFIIGNEVICGVLTSQIISNVPAAMLLTGFSTNYEAIIVGINIGGFGTLIASMANLISFKILAREFEEFKARYLVVFTVFNVILLVILLGVNFLM